MAQFARPDSTIAGAADWDTRPTAGQAEWAQIDETVANETDHIFVTLQSVIIELGLSNVTDPVASTGHILRVRARRAGGGADSAQIRTRLLQGATEITLRTSALTTNFGPADTFTYTLSAAEADAITDYSDLRVEFRKQASSPVDVELTIYWFEFEVPDVIAARTHQMIL